MDGYWGAPDDDVIDSEGWIHTGDLGYLDAENYLYVVGRSKEVIIRGGENVASAHVEERLLEHQDVLECAVLGLPDDDLGEDVAAVVVLRPSSTIDAVGLAAFLGDKLSYFEILCPATTAAKSTSGVWPQLGHQALCWCKGPHQHLRGRDLFSALRLNVESSIVVY
jgi:acyl-CoA synthetase (AMP-forming)/AMP-acid ligase II